MGESEGFRTKNGPISGSLAEFGVVCSLLILFCFVLLRSSGVSKKVLFSVHITILP